MARPVAEVSITGYAELRRALAKLEPELVPELRDGMKQAADVVSAEASRRLSSAVASNSRRKRPARSEGLAAASIRAVSSGNTIYVKAGGARTAYYGWLDYGGDLKPQGRRRNRQSRPFLKKGRFLYPAIAAKSGEMIRQAEQAFDNATRKAGLG